MTLPAIFNDKHSGFTLIELLITIGIILVLAGASAPIYGNLQVSSQLNESSAQIVQMLRVARSRSVAQLNNASHGVYFEHNVGGDDRYILYQGESYATRSAQFDRSIPLQNSLSFITTLSGNEVNFSRGIGEPNTTGMVTLTHDITGSRIITINSLGIVEEH